MKNEKIEQKINPRLELQVSAYLPSTYVTAQDQKIDFYQRIYNAASTEELKDLEEELTDRYGITPEPVKMLFQVAQLRIIAAELGVELIQQKQGFIVLQFSPAPSFDQALLGKDFLADRERVIVSSRQPLILKIRGVGQTVSLIEDISRFLKDLAVIRQPAVGDSEAI